MFPPFKTAAERLAFVAGEVDLLASQIGAPPSLLPTLRDAGLTETDVAES